MTCVGRTGICVSIPISFFHLPGHSDDFKDEHETSADLVGANVKTFVGALKKDDLFFPLGL